MLQEWATFNLKERCRLIEKKFDIKCGYNTLRSCYIRNKVAYRNTIQVKRRSYESRHEFNQKRAVYAEFLQQLVKEGRPVIYQDESQFHSWMARKKGWATIDSPIEIVINNRHHAVSVFGAIGHCLKES